MKKLGTTLMSLFFISSSYGQASHLSKLALALGLAHDSPYGQLLTENDLNEELFQAIENKEVKTVKQLLDKGANPNFRFNNYTHLMVASYNRSADIARLLLEAGADPSIQHKSGLRALDWAKTAGGKSETEKLLEKATEEQAYKNSFKNKA